MGRKRRDGVEVSDDDGSLQPGQIKPEDAESPIDPMAMITASVPR